MGQGKLRHPNPNGRILAGKDLHELVIGVKTKQKVRRSQTGEEITPIQSKISLLSTPNFDKRRLRADVYGINEGTNKSLEFTPERKTNTR